MTNRTNYLSGTPWEPLRGYSRMVQSGDTVYVSGTTAQGENGKIVGGDNAYQQTRHILEKVSGYLQQAGYYMQDVIQTRLYVTDMKQWQEISQAHQEVFDKIRPASSLVEVAKLRDPRLLVEIELVARKSEGDVKFIELK